MLYSLTTKYAVIALVELAEREAATPVRDIARAREIPSAFLAKLVPQLVRAGILSSTRGKNGGISFARSPSRVSLADVVRTIEGEGYFRECVFELFPCDGRPGCPLHDLWDPLRDRIRDFLEDTTIKSVADKLAAAKER
ncbi:Rrf2 family transcriptional regulator [Candidatus Bipolaricaulota bacterium]|jgi:Rrf2 family protein|nr:Rrf2 family transcriptional regulator [Candidatus Bipolaricaulota bacterium]